MKMLLKRERSLMANESTILLSFGAFCQQAITKRIFLISNQYLIVILFGSSFLIHSFYTSALVSILISTKADISVKDLDELGNSDIPIGFCNIGSIKNYMNVIYILRSEKVYHSLI